MATRTAVRHAACGPRGLRIDRASTSTRDFAKRSVKTGEWRGPDERIQSGTGTPGPSGLELASTDGDEVGVPMTT